MKLLLPSKTTIKVDTYTSTILKSITLKDETMDDTIVRLIETCGGDVQKHYFIEDGMLTYEVMQVLRPVTLIWKVFKDNRIFNPSEIFTQGQKREKEKQCEELIQQ